MEDQILDPNTKDQLPVTPLDERIVIPTTKPWYKNGRVILTLLVGLILVFGVSWYFIWGKPPVGDPTSNDVSVIIKGPSTISSGAEAEYRIIYTNNENGDLTNVSLNVIYPSNFTFKSALPAPITSSGTTFNLPILSKGANAEVVIRGKISGSTGEDKQIQAKLHYKLSNFNSTFDVNETFHTTIQAPNLTLDISGPTEVPIGQDVKFNVNYTNVSAQDYENVVIQLSYPTDFKFTSASIAPSKNNNYWQIGKLPINGNGQIDIVGSFMDNGTDQQLLSAQLGLLINNNFASQITSTATFKLKKPTISITQTLSPSDHVNLGDEIQVTINYANESQIGLTNLIITDTINTNLLDTTRFTVSDAIVSGNTITWKAGTNSNLSILTPGARGQVQFTLPLKSNLPTTAKTQVITNSVSVISPEITSPIKAPDKVIKLATDMKVTVSGDYISGAIPMEVGKPTTFALTYLLTNTTNDLENVEVVANLPLPPSAWKNVILPQTEATKITYDPTSSKIRWKLGSVPAFTGKLTPAAKVTFQITVTPGPSDQGEIIRLLSDVVATATDKFTTEEIILNPASVFTTANVDDIGDNASTVQ